MKFFWKKHNKLSRRITWQVILIVLFFNVLIIGAICVFVFLVSLVNSSMRSQYVIDGIGGKMETMMQVVKTTAYNSRAEVERNLGSPDLVFEALTRDLQVNRKLTGSFAAFEPGYFKSQGHWFEAYAYFTDSAHIEQQQIGSARHDYLNRTWYKEGMKRDKLDNGYLTDPYFDDSVLSNMYCSYVLPIFDSQGRKVGVYGVDLNINWLEETIGEQKKRIEKEFFNSPDFVNGNDEGKYFYILVLDSSGKCIAGEAPADSAKDAGQTPAYMKWLKGERRKISEILEMEDLKGTPYYMNSKQLANTNWTLVVLQHYDMVFMWGQFLAAVILLFMGAGGLVIFFFMSRSIRRAMKPLGYLTDGAQEVAKGNFDTVLPTFRHKDEISQLRDSFDTMQQSLKKYVEEVKESTAAKAAIVSELNVAHSIQMSMLPKTFPAFPNRNDIDLYGSLTPAKAVGGDLYDFFIRDEKLFFCIGDVSGKGVPASLVMAVTRTLFRNISVHTTKPSHIVETMNWNVSEGNENLMFVTLFVGVLDLASGQLRFCNAGHDNPVIIENGEHRTVDCIANLPIGVMADRKYKEQEMVMAPGSMLFLYTDGLTEAENKQLEQFGKERMHGVVGTFTGNAPQQLIEAMTLAVHQFVGDMEQSDDLTMLAIKFTH